MDGKIQGRGRSGRGKRPAGAIGQSLTTRRAIPDNTPTQRKLAHEEAKSAADTHATLEAITGTVLHWWVSRTATGTLATGNTPCPRVPNATGCPYSNSSLKRLGKHRFYRNCSILVHYARHRARR